MTIRVAVPVVPPPACDLPADLALDLADSELAGADWVTAPDQATPSLTLRLAAAALRPQRPRLGAGDETVYLSGLQMVLDGVAQDALQTIGRPIGEWAGRLSGGSLQAAGQRWSRLPVGPARAFVAHGPLRLELQLARGPVLSLQASRLRLTWPDDASDPRPALAC